VAALSDADACSPVVALPGTGNQQAVDGENQGARPPAVMRSSYKLALQGSGIKMSKCALSAFVST
jgi:hypothetical protein